MGMLKGMLEGLLFLVFSGYAEVCVGGCWMVFGGAFKTCLGVNKPVSTSTLNAYFCIMNTWS